MDLTSLKARYRDRLDWASIIQGVRFAFFRARRVWNRPDFQARVLNILSWFFAASFYGLIVGAAVVVAPPMAAISLTILPFPFILWALPDLPTVPAQSLRQAVYAALAVVLCVPTYYMVQLPGIPWISARRVFVFPLVLLTLYALAISAKERGHISRILGKQRWLSFCLIGFPVMAALSIITSHEPALSISQLSEAALNWYMPFFAVLLVIRSDMQLEKLFKYLTLLAIPVFMLGIADFMAQRNFALDVIPARMLASIISANPSFTQLIAGNGFRNGMYRADSIFNVALSFGEFAAMMAPAGIHYVLHGKSLRTRGFGLAFLFCAMLSLLAAGSRGGNLGFLVSAPALVALYLVRYMRANPRSMAGPIAAACGLMALVASGGLILSSTRLRNSIFGGGAAAASTNGREEQLQMALPHILANPITGHGLGTAAQVVNWHNAASIDSYLLSLLVETGAPGAIFYFGMIALAIMLAVRTYLKDDAPSARIAAPLAASLLAYGVYRLFLSQRENQTLLFVAIALVYILSEISRQRRNDLEIVVSGQHPKVAD